MYKSWHDFMPRNISWYDFWRHSGNRFPSATSEHTAIPFGSPLLCQIISLECNFHFGEQTEVAGDKISKYRCGREWQLFFESLTLMQIEWCMNLTHCMMQTHFWLVHTSGCYCQTCLWSCLKISVELPNTV